MKKSLVFAKHMAARTTVKKAAPVLDLIRNKSVSEAARVLKFNPTKVAALTLKVLNSAIANAKNNLDLKEDKLYISETFVTEGFRMKRYRPVARGRINPLLKRTSHLVVGLSERSQ